MGLNINLNPQLLGFIIGDGFVYRKKKRKNYVIGFTQSIKNTAIINYYSKLLAELKNNVQKEKAPHNTLKVYVYSKKCFEEILAIKGNLIKHLAKYGEHEKNLFIAGLFDAEGHVGKSSYVIYNKNLNLLNTIRIYLNGKGITSKIYKGHKVYELHIFAKKKFLKLIIDNSIKLKTHQPSPEKGCLRSWG